MSDKRNSKRRKSEGSRLFKAIISGLLVVFAVYVVFTLVHQQVEIAEKKDQLEKLNEEIVIQEVKNDEMKQVNEYDDSENDVYIERVARQEFDYSKQGERVFVNVAGE